MRQIEQRVGVSDSQCARPGLRLDDRVTCLDESLAEHAHVEAGAVMADEQCGQLGLTTAATDAIAGDPRLRDLELGTTDAITVPDADLVVGKTVDGEVLAELSIREVPAPEVLLPIRVRLELVHEH